MTGPCRNVPLRRISHPYRLDALVRSILKKKTGRISRQRCRPMLSGPTEKKNEAMMEWEANSSHNLGTPYLVPLKVSTSILRPVFITFYVTVHGFRGSGFTKTLSL
jgi:hypothetical protein